MNRIFYKNIFRLINQSTSASLEMNAMNYFVFGDSNFYVSGPHDAEVAKSLFIRSELISKSLNLRKAIPST